MHEAFQLDDEDEDHTETTPLTHAYTTQQDDTVERPSVSVSTAPAYDFERDYDYDFPPPGSPPDPSAARPNDFGNSNGVLPENPVRPATRQRSIFGRVVGALLPQRYQRLPTDAAGQRTVGGGLDNDGVFNNVQAKPARTVEVRNEDGSIYVVPEDAQNAAPPVSIFVRLSHGAVGLTAHISRTTKPRPTLSLLTGRLLLRPVSTRMPP